MRPIDGDALYKGMEQQYCTACNSYNNIRCKACDVADCLRWIDDMPTVEAEPVKHGQRIDGWIFVEDELPKDSEKVLCLTVGNFYEILCKIIGGWRCPLTSQEFYTDFVRYWQPLPKLPERSDTNAERPL